MSIKQEKVEEWVADLLRSHGVNVVKWNNNEMGLLNVPAKWCAVISDLTVALVAVGAGDPLPKLLKKGKGKTL